MVLKTLLNGTKSIDKQSCLETYNLMIYLKKIYNLFYLLLCEIINFNKKRRYLKKYKKNKLFNESLFLDEVI